MNNIRMITKEVINGLNNGDIRFLTGPNITLMNKVTIDILNRSKNDINSVICDLNIIKDIIYISNVLYNNTTLDILPLEDGIYDLLFELYTKLDKDYIVGAPVIGFKNITLNKPTAIIPASIIPNYEKHKEDMLFFEELTMRPEYDKKNHAIHPINIVRDNSKMVRDTPHIYPKLVGTLDKCKFVTIDDAKKYGVLDDPSVRIFERDFLGKHLEMGIIDPHDISVSIEIKYDGVAIEAEVSDHIISARTRGDTNSNVTADISDMFGAHMFPHAPTIDETFGMKFEAIVTNKNFNLLKDIGKEYKNPRNAVIGLISGNDRAKYERYITLVPLETSLEDIDRETEKAFMNKYYHDGTLLLSTTYRGNYINVLFVVREFLKNAEAIREGMSFMYDGIVVSYTDQHVIEALGRQNSVNKYSTAIKFNSMNKKTRFIDYDYTVGQNGTITPMIQFQPVEFYGNVQSQSSAHSYARFNDLALRQNDIINIEYRNDVMAYVTKEDCIENDTNPNPIIEFPKICPDCGDTLQFTEKNAFCPRFECVGRTIARTANMFKKLNLKDFAEATFRELLRNNIRAESLKELLTIHPIHITEVLGEIMGNKLLERLEYIKTANLYDYELIGAIGFSNIANEKWKLILKNITIEELINLSIEELYSRLSNVKGLGSNTIEVIYREIPYFKEDLIYISNMNNIIRSYGITAKAKSIRFTGIRDQELVNQLESLGYDASGESVTKNTNILIIPYEGFTSTKVNKVSENTLIVPLSDFKNNLDKYLSLI